MTDGANDAGPEALREFMSTYPTGVAVNLLRTGSRATADLFASRTPDRFGRVAWRPSRRSGLPWLVDDAYALAECRLAGTLPVGDHVVVLGQVVEAHTSAGDPLAYVRRGYTQLPLRRDDDRAA